MHTSVKAAAAEQLQLRPEPGGRRPRTRGVRSVVRAEQLARDAYEAAKGTDDAVLIERARRAWMRTWKVAPAHAVTRRRTAW